MTNDEIKGLILGELHRIAPEVDLDQIDPEGELREQVDLDSMDILNWIIAIHEATGVDIPESDYSLITTLNKFTSYLAARLK